MSASVARGCGAGGAWVGSDARRSGNRLLQRSRGRRGAIDGNWSGKAVALPYYGFDKAGLLRVVAKGKSDLADRRIDAVVDVDEDVLAPEAGGDLFARDQFPVASNQEDEQLHGELLQPQNPVGPLQAVAGLVEGEVAEMEFLGRNSLSCGAFSALGMMPHVAGTINSVSKLQVHLIFISTSDGLHCRMRRDLP